MLDNANSVAIEVVGHDHIADLRYHSSQNIAGITAQDAKFDFHNMFVAPGITPGKNNNPGVALFEISDAGVPSNLKMEFIDIQGVESKASLSYSDLNFRSFDLAKDFGFSDISGNGLAELRKYLEDPANYDQAIRYLVTKVGFNPDIPAEFDRAIGIYTEMDLVSSKKHKIGEFLCQMHKSTSADEYKECTDGVDL